MKILHVILIMYIIGLQALPCADQLDSCDVELVKEHTHDSPSHSEEDCSPFCACHCCRTQMINIEIITAPLKEHKSTIKIIPIPFAFVMQESQNHIWQPPKKC